MTNVKAEFKIGTIEFSGEGEKEWVTEQLDKILEKAPKLLNLVPQQIADSKINSSKLNPPDTKNSTTRKPLATFLKENNATTNQNDKFLATAIWLQDKENKARLDTKEVTKALSDSKQSRLGNASECLNQNVAKGFCEKDGNGFYVTEEGRNEILK